MADYQNSNPSQNPSGNMASYGSNPDANSFSEDNSYESDQTVSNHYNITPHKSNLLETFVDSINIAEHFKKERRDEIANILLTQINDDKQTMKHWLDDVEEAQKLMRLTKEPKNTPLPNSSNVKFPLITNACYQFHARTYPEIIQDAKIVKGQVLTKDVDGSLAKIAANIGQHMSYQLQADNSDWEASMDSLLVMLPAVGQLFKKSFFDPIKKCNSSLLCDYKDVILRNTKEIHNLCDQRRITHTLYLNLNDLITGCRFGIFCEDAVNTIVNRQKMETIRKPLIIEECHCYLDLDGDDYEEPYIVTIDRESRQILRIFARFDKDGIDVTDDGQIKQIKAIQAFTDYGFLPSTDGRFMHIGFGTMMLHLNDTVNSILNQLIDAGSLANMQTGFMDASLKIEGGVLTAKPGSWNRVKGVGATSLKEGVLPINYKEPSSVLFQLLGLLIQSAKELSSSTEIMQGTQNAQNVPATTIMALVEQGMKVFNSIQKRLYRALKDEYKKLFALNAKYLDPIEYFMVVGEDVKTISQTDYQRKDVTVIPIADPSLSSDAQRYAKLQFLLQLSQNPAIGPKLNVAMVTEYALDVADFPNPQQFINMDPPAPDPKMIKAQTDAKVKQVDMSNKTRHQQLAEARFAADANKRHAGVQEMHAKSLKLIADASKAAHDAKMSEAGMGLDVIKTKLQAMSDAHNQMGTHNVNHAKVVQKQQEINNQDQQAHRGMDIDENSQQAQSESNNPVEGTSGDQGTTGNDTGE